MSSSSRSRPDEVRKRILQEATRLFSQKGFEGTSIQSVAEAVGIRKPSLLYHFASKEVLREQVLAELLGHWQNEIPKLLMAATDEEDRLSSIVSALIAFFEQDPDRARLVIREILDRPEGVRSLIREQLTPWVKLITDYIRQDRGLGLIHPEVRPGAYVAQVILMVLGTIAAREIASELVDSNEKSASGLVNSGEDAASELKEELKRMARESLFSKPSAQQERKESIDS